MKLQILFFGALISSVFILGLYALTAEPQNGERFIPAVDVYPTMRLVPGNQAQENPYSQINPIPIPIPVFSQTPTPDSLPPPPKILAVGFTNLGTSANPDINSNTDATSYTNSSWTPPTTGMIVVWVTSTANTVNPTMNGNGITWVRISTFRVSTQQISLFAADATGATIGATTVDFGAETQTRCAASFSQITGADEDNGVAQTFIQTPTASGSGTSGSITLAAAADGGNRPISGWFHNANEGSTPRTNWTEVDDLTSTAPVWDTESQFRSDAFETTASASWTSSVNFRAMAAAIKIATGAAVTRFLVLNDAQCLTLNVGTDADCWSTSSGGNGNGLPVAGDSLQMDANSGAGAGMQNADLLQGAGTSG